MEKNTKIKAASGTAPAAVVASEPKTLTGKVVSDKMKDTIVVAVDTFNKMPKYGKYMKSTKRFQAHDAGNTKKIGDTVTIVETRPISKNKHFRVI
ncbi:MAG: 30S ribosomal protein S17 [bacterium]